MQHYDYDRVLAEISRRIKEARKARQLTQMDMVTKYGYHLTQWRTIESGQMLSMRTLVRVANTLELTLADLVGGIEKLNGLGFGSKGFKDPPEDGGE